MKSYLENIPPPLFHVTAVRSFLEKKISFAIDRFPNVLDNQLFKGLERLIVNSPGDFLITRTSSHLQTLLLTQFFLQKRMEAFLQYEGAKQNHLFLKLFQYPSRICIAITFLDSYRFHREQLLRTIQTLLPGIQEIPRSFFLWHHPELPYLFCYLEINKTRGEQLSGKDLKKLQNTIKEQLLVTPPLTPALFWPYNEEESYRQVQLLLNEMRSKEDLPHVSIHFQEQTQTSLEFLIHLARPKSSEPLHRSLERLPNYLDFFCHFQYVSKSPFPIEIGAFALKVPSHAFDVRDSINLLYARRYILKFLEETLGACRDYNGGLFEKQQHHFETIRVHLSDKIPLFDVFAEKVFYALRPVEKRLTLSIKEASELFTCFSDAMQGKGAIDGKCQFENITIVKTANKSELPRFSHINKESKKGVAHAQLSFGGFHYHCILGLGAEEVQSFVKNSSRSREKTKTLKLIFEEGKPTSLNPYHASGDMRCRVLCKLLFEGLIRLNEQGVPEPAGALNYHSSQEGTIYNFKLRPNCWSNGERVTAIDYAASLKRALRNLVSHPENLYVIKNAQKFKEKKVDATELGLRVLDSDALQVELEYPDPKFLHNLAQPFFFPLFGSMQEPKWFNGPYLVRELGKDGMLLERNPYFWNTKNLYFEEIDIRWVDEIDTIYTLLQEGKTDWIGDPLTTFSNQLITQLEGDGNLQEQSANRHFNIYYNSRHPVLCSPSIRRALSISIDRQLICKTIYPHSIPLYPLHPSREEANHLFEKGLDELGLTRETFPTLIFSYSHQARREQLAQYLQSTWEEILGINICLEQIEWNTFRNRVEKGQFEMVCMIQNIEGDDSPRFFERFEGMSSWNFSKWKHADYKKIIGKARAETDKEMRKFLLAQAEQVLIQEAPFTPLLKYTHLYAHSPDLKGYMFDDEGCVDFSKAQF